MYLFQSPLNIPGLAYCLAYGSCLLNAYKEEEINVCLVCLLLGHSDYLNVRVVLSFSKVDYNNNGFILLL